MRHLISTSNLRLASHLIRGLDPYAESLFSLLLKQSRKKVLGVINRRTLNTCATMLWRRELSSLSANPQVKKKTVPNKFVAEASIQCEGLQRFRRLLSELEH